MPKLEITPPAREEYRRLDGSVKAIFAKHIKQLEAAAPRKFLHSGMRYSVEIAGQGRIVCAPNGEVLEILHFFATHKEYEKWYRGQK